MGDVLMLASYTPVSGRPRRAAAATEPRFTVVRQQGHALWPSMRAFGDTFAAAGNGASIAFAMPLDTPIVTRLMTLMMFRVHRLRAEHTIRRSGGIVVARYGVDPSLDRPAYFFELNTAAAVYANQFIRPRGSIVAIRRLVALCCGCDPALGGVLIVGRKQC